MQNNQSPYRASPAPQQPMQYPTAINPQNLLTSSIFLPQNVQPQYAQQQQYLQQLQLIQQQQLLYQHNRVVKFFIKPGSEIRKTIVSLSGLSLQTIKTKVHELVSKKPELANESFSLFYKDEEGDWVRLENDEDWQCFVDSAPAPPVSWKIKAKFTVKAPAPAPAPVAQVQVAPVQQQQQQQQLPLVAEPKQFNYAPPESAQQPLPVKQQLTQQPILVQQQPAQQEPPKVIPAVIAQPVVVQPVAEIKKPVEQAPAPVPVEQVQPQPIQEQGDSFVCDSCKQQISAARYQCTHCSDYDLCLGCYPFRFNYHPENHNFKLVDAGAKPAPVVPIVEEPKIVDVQPVAVPKPVIEEPKPVIVEKPVEPVKPAEEPFKYETEEKLLINMGLDDKEKVRKLLIKHQGAVNSVVDEYFSS